MPRIKLTVPEGMTVRYSSEYQEYRVNFKGASERYAYYTNDRDDAVLTAQHMSNNRPATIKPDLRITRND